MWTTANEQNGNGSSENYSGIPGEGTALPVRVKPIEEMYAEAVDSIRSAQRGGFDKDWKNAPTANVYDEKDLDHGGCDESGWGTSEIGQRILNYFNIGKKFSESNSPFGEHILTLMQYKTLYDMGEINSLDMLYIALHFITKEEKQNRIFEEEIIKKYAVDPMQAENIKLVLDVAKAGYYEKIAENLPEDIRKSIADFIQTVASDNGSNPENILVSVPGANGEDANKQIVNLELEPELGLVYAQMSDLLKEGTCITAGI